MIEAVFFDLYETLVTEFDPGWKKKTPLGERLGLGVERFREEWRARRRPRHTGAYRDYRAVLREICKTMGETPDGDLIQTLYTERCNAKTAPFSEIRRDIIGLLEDLEEMKLRIGLITNSEPEDVAAWPRSDLAPFFDDAVFSHKIGYMKPDPEIYQIASRRMKVNPEESVFVGDGGSHELEGAARAGMKPIRAVWYSVQWAETAEDPHNEADTTYPQLQSPGELVNILTELD